LENKNVTNVYVWSGLVRERSYGREHSHREDLQLIPGAHFTNITSHLIPSAVTCAGWLTLLFQILTFAFTHDRTTVQPPRSPDTAHNLPHGICRNVHAGVLGSRPSLGLRSGQAMLLQHDPRQYLCSSGCVRSFSPQAQPRCNHFQPELDKHS